MSEQSNRAVHRWLAILRDTCSRCAAALLGLIGGSTRPAVSITVDQGVLKPIRDALSASSRVRSVPTEDEREWLDRISRQSAAANRNNVTRTAAYLRMYERYPELHWALLAHMVSRNGGYNMTDLQGEHLPLLMADDVRERHFQLLERCNSYIFHDAYPQLLLYHWSREMNRPLFHLLPHLHVSAFMEPFWQLFWGDPARNRALLAVALIVNEQHYIERRIVRNPFFRRHVLDTLPFRIQSLLQMDQIVFPIENRTTSASPLRITANRRPLAGVKLGDFSLLRDRIRTGKQLYATLFGDPRLLDGIARFAAAVPHTGSRADYWPEWFTTVRPSPEMPKSAVGAPAWMYSPELTRVWPDRDFVPPERYDWYDDVSEFPQRDFYNVTAPRSYDMSRSHLAVFDKLRMASAAGRLFR